MVLLPQINTFWLNSMPHGVDIVKVLHQNMLKLLLPLKPMTQLFLQLKLMPPNIKNQEVDLEFKDSQLLNGLSMDNHLIIKEEELNQLSFNGLKKRFHLHLLNKHLLNKLKLSKLPIKLPLSISEMLKLNNTKLLWILAKLLMMSLSDIVTVLMLELIIKLKPIPQFYSDNLMNLNFLIVENLPLLPLLIGSVPALYPLLVNLIKLQLKEFSEITSLLFSY